MVLGPLFRREYRAAARSRRPFATRMVFATILGGVLGLLAWGVFGTRGPMAAGGEAERLHRFGQLAFVATFVAELIFLMSFVPAFVAPAVAEEREKDTLALLLITRLRPSEVAAVKALARWAPAASLALTGLPVLLVAGWLGGLHREAGLALLVLLGSSGFMACAAVLASARRELAGNAQAEAVGWALGWMVVPPFFSLVPIRTGEIWGDLLDLLKTICSYVAPSSPVSLVTDRGWYTLPPGAATLPERVALMLALQLVGGAGLLLLAAGHLRARDRAPNWADPTRGYRPPVGDDPIFWRELDLPRRRGGGSLLRYQLRHVRILLVSLLLVALQLVGTLIVLAIPVALALATLHYGLAAAREAWEQGSGSPAPAVARGHFAFLLRCLTGLLLFLPALNLPATVAGRITAERSKRSWEILLATPLDGAAIVGAKVRAAAFGLRALAKPVAAAWVLGVALGATAFWGPAVAALDLWLLARACLALGFVWSLRPDMEPIAATTRVTWSTLALLAAHGPLLYLVLASPHELEVVASWPGWARWSVVAGAVAVLGLTAFAAWSLDRRVRTRFDEWAGRPSRAGQRRPEAAEVRTRPVPARGDAVVAVEAG